MRKYGSTVWQALVGCAVLLFVGSAGLSYADTNNKPTVRFGIQTAQQVEDLNDLSKLWQEAEELGFDSAWTFDHFIPIVADPKGPCYDGWTLLAALAAKTSRMRIGCLVTGNTYRNPAVLAKMATTVDHISGGRLQLGIGAAWFKLEHQAYGIPFYTAKERVDRMEEAVQLIRMLWTEKETNFTGKYYQLVDAPFEPKPLQKPYPPILIGGRGKKWTLPIVAKYADAWNAGGLSPAGMAELIEVLNGYCRQFDRNCADIEKTFATLMVLSDNEQKVDQVAQLVAQARGVTPEQARATMLMGTSEEVKEQVQAYIDAGVEHIIIAMRQPYDREGLRRFAQEVMPEFR